MSVPPISAVRNHVGYMYPFPTHSMRYLLNQDVNVAAMTTVTWIALSSDYGSCLLT